MTGGFGSNEGGVRYAHALRTHWLLIAGVTALALLVAGLVTATAQDRYDAGADVQIQAMAAFGNDPLQGLDVFRQPTDGSSPAVAAARVFSAPQYRQALRRALGPQADAVSVDVTPLSQASIVSIGASAPSAALAARAANRYVAIVVRQRNATFRFEVQRKINQIATQAAALPAAGRATNPVYQGLAGQIATLRGWLGSGDPTVQLLTAATPPAGPSWPRPKLTLLVALAVGLLLGVAAAVALELVNPRVRREDELALAHRLPVLARVPRLPARRVEDYLLGRSLLPGDAWKGYRTLRAVLENAGIGGGLPRSLLVTSASPGDGKTLTAVNTAIALAASGLRVTLVDADFHRPMIGAVFNVAGRRDGLVRLLEDPEEGVVDTIESPSQARLRLLLSSREQIHRLHLFETQRIAQALERLLQDCDVVVVDSPPLPEVAEALALAEAVEGVVVCVRVGHTRRDRLDDLRDLLARRGVTPLGFFVTSRRRSQPAISDYDYSAGLTTTPSGMLAPSQETVSPVDV